MKKSLQIARNGDPEDRQAKEQARAEKANKWTDPSSANCSENNEPLKKRAGWKMAQAKSVKKSGSQERKEPYVRESIHTT